MTDRFTRQTKLNMDAEQVFIDIELDFDFTFDIIL